MHPIERIRSLARATHLDPPTIAVEAADAIAETCEWEAEAAAVSVARRLLAWHPFVGPLWYSAGRILHAVDPSIEAVRLADELLDDPTALMLDAAIPEDAVPIVCGHAPGVDAVARRGMVRVESDANPVLVLVCATALGPDGLFAPAPALEMVQRAVESDGRVWAVAGRGTAVDARLWARLTDLHARGCSGPRSRVVSNAWWDFDDFGGPAELDLVPLDCVSFVCGPDGLVEPAEAAAAATPAPVELLDAAGADAF